ncbi:uncharacterized protein LOC104443746 [Eucalyptus grandis]|uniref:uncharacterized protein LOC104443746 n=1 Tax=Eucalyptus grandis TaxID=71139 RepID=UPI00192EFEE0|nr:uncharacterized protein LOC104443746 [Eucalyptus grandis]
MVSSILQIAVAPITAGLLLNRFFPWICNAIRPLLPPLSILLLIIAFHLSAFVIGYFFFQKAPVVKALQRTLSFETGMQSSLLALALANRFFQDPLVAVPPAISFPKSPELEYFPALSSPSSRSDDGETNRCSSRSRPPTFSPPRRPLVPPRSAAFLASSPPRQDRPLPEPSRGHRARLAGRAAAASLLGVAAPAGCCCCCCLALSLAGPASAAAETAALVGPSLQLAEPANALSLPTWVVHVSSVVEWITAMALVWQYGEVSGYESWKGLSWGMVPLLGGAFCACTWHFFYNSESLEVLVALQAALTVIGNATMCFAAFRIYRASEERRGKL